MSIKKIFETQLKQQQTEIARQALKQAFRGGIPGRYSMKEIMDELKEDPTLWDSFQDLRFQELKEMISPPANAYGAPGPNRKRGITSNRITDFVRQNPGARRADIMKALGLKGGTVSSQLRTLRSTGKLRSEGEERNLQYYSV